MAIQGGVRFQDLRQDSAFLAAPPVEQVQYLQEAYLPSIDPEFAQAPPEEQQQYIQEVVLPEIKAPEILSANTGQLMPDSPQPPQVPTVELPDYDPNNPMQIAKDLAGATMGASTGALKGLSLGYLDLTKDAQQAADAIGAKYYSPEIAAGGGELAGALPVFQGIGAGITKGAQAVGRAMLPRTSQLAQAAGVGSNFHRAAMNAATWVQSGGMLPLIARTATEMGVYEGFKSLPGQQLDFGERAKHAAIGVGIGAAFPVAGRVLKAGVKAVRPSTAPVGVRTQAARAAQAEIRKHYERAVEVFGKLQRGEIDPALVSPDDYAELVLKLDELGNALKAGVKVKNPETATRIARRVEGKAKIQALKEKRPLNVKKAQTELENRPEQPAQRPQEVQQQAPLANQQQKEAVTPKTRAIKRTVKKTVREYTPKVQAELDKIDRAYEAKINTLKQGKSISGSVYIESQIKGAGIERAAARRRAIQGDSLEKVEGGLTDAELAALKQKEATNYTGKAVVVEGKSGKVQNVVFGKVKVKLDTGEVVTVDPKAVKPAPRPKAEPTFVEKEVEEVITEEVPAPETPPPATLTGTIKEMVAQVEKEAGLPSGAGELTAGQLEKQMGQKLTPEQKDIHTNLRAVARAEVVDEARGIHQQLPLSGRELKFDDVKDGIGEAFQKDAKTIDEAMGQGKAVRVEYVAEEAGRSAEAAKITNAGNIKVETTTFTPLYRGKTKEGKTLLHGYNQRGFFTTYHLEPSASGSQILKAKATDKAPFVGEYSNVYLGQRPFLAKDVLNRGVRSEAGPVKTSEAISMLEEVTSNLDKVFALADDPRLSVSLRKTITTLRDAPKWGRKEMMQFKRLTMSKEFKTTVCSILGLKQ